jgi:hypothetical protein
MRIAVNPLVEREEPQAFRRNVRRLLYLAHIASDEGHSVWLAPYDSTARETLFRPELTAWLRALADSLDCMPGLPEGINLAICSSSQAVAMAAKYPGTRLVVFKEDIDYRKDRRLVGIAELIPCCVWRREDFTESERRPVDDPDHDEVMGAKVLATPWLPHDRVLLQLEEDRLAWSFMKDELEVIRRRYAGTKRWRLGFIGADEPETRRKALDALQETGLLDYCQTYRPVAWIEPPEQYLAWLSQCQAIPDLPGDQWNCYRFAETVLMGVPSIRLEGKASFTPPLTGDNCILVRQWGDRAAIAAGLARADQIVAEADRCYRAGWSLRGQFRQVLRRLRLN